MASFEELLAKAEANNADNTVQNNMASILTTSLVADENSSWKRSANSTYAYYPEFSDDDLSLVNGDKTITLSANQINLTAEQNSQVIPFRLNRYYDGIDMMNMTFIIYYINRDGNDGYSSPINVEYNNAYIKFYWLIDENVTAVAGSVTFEIQARGTVTDYNGQSVSYVWKSRPNNSLNVLASLKGNGAITPSTDWTESFFKRIAAETENAQNIYNQVLGVQSNIQNNYSGLMEQVQTNTNDLATFKEQVQTAFNGVYTSEQIDGIITEIENNASTLSDKVTANDGKLTNLKTDLENEISSIKENQYSVSYDSTNKKLSITVNGETTDYNIEPNAEWTSSFRTTVAGDIDAKVEVVDAAFKTYKTATDTRLDAIEGKIANVSDDAIGAADVDKQIDAKLTSVNENISSIRSDVNTNKTNIGSISTKVQELDAKMENVSVDSPLQYEAEYDTENRFTLWEIDTKTEERTPKGSFVITGGGGGGSTTTTTAKIERVTPSPYIVTKESDVVLEFIFSSLDASGDDTGEGTAVVKVDNVTVKTVMAIQGNNKIDLTDNISIGTHKVALTVTDSAGTIVVKTWTVQKVDVRIDSNFNDKLTYPMGAVSFDYTPYGSVEKTIHFILDGKELGTVKTTASGLPMSYNIPAQEHGSHLLDIYATAEINNIEIETNHIYKDIIWYDSNSDKPVVGCTFVNETVTQYDNINIDYVVYDPKTETPTVTLAVDGNNVSTLTLDGYSSTWQYKPTVIGNHILTITCGETVKTINIEVTKLDINLEPVTANLAFDFNPSGRTNNDQNRLWSSNYVSMSVSDNFDWVNGGYQIDENGDQYFRVNAGTTATIDYKLFADDAKRNGKEFKLIFKTENVGRADATFLSCEDSDIGIQMNVHEAYIKASAGSLYLPYSEEDIIEFEFNISKITDEIPMVLGYEDGVATRPLVYSESHNFTQNNPKDIVIGSPDCDILIYRMKVYSASLTDRGILNNFIADARNATDMVDRYTRNQIYDENSQLTPETLAQKCPDLRILMLETPYFTNNKSDKVSGGTLRCIYANGDPVQDNWVAHNIIHNGQGTTSNEYGAAGRNLEFNMQGEDCYFVMGDGVTQQDNITLTRNSIPTDYLNLKVNIASSENVNNAYFQERYNRFNPYIRPARQNNPNVKDTMEFVNAVLFIRETNEDVSTHREFQDTEWHLYAGVANIGDSKKTDKTRLDDPDDPLECIVEIMDNTLANSTFSGTPEALAALETDNFDEKGTYGWRYIKDKKDATVTQPCIDAWKNFYKFVATSTDEEFKEKLSDYFVVDTALFFYLFTLRYTMIDNRAKNTFWHYSKRDDGKYRWDLCMDYDNDSALGIKC